MCAALMSEPMAPCFTMSCAMVALTWLGFGFGFGFGLGLAPRVRVRVSAAPRPGAESHAV